MVSKTFCCYFFSVSPSDIEKSIFELQNIYETVIYHGFIVFFPFNAAPSAVGLLSGVQALFATVRTPGFTLVTEKMYSTPSPSKSWYHIVLRKMRGGVLADGHQCRSQKLAFDGPERLICWIGPSSAAIDFIILILWSLMDFSMYKDNRYSVVKLWKINLDCSFSSVFKMKTSAFYHLSLYFHSFDHSLE